MVFLDLETVVPYCFIREERGVLPSEGFFTFTLGLRIFTESFLSCFLDNEL